MAFGVPSAAVAAGSRKSPMTRLIASFVMRMFQCRSSTIAGHGSCWRSMNPSACFTCAISGASSPVSR